MPDLDPKALEAARREFLREGAATPPLSRAIRAYLAAAGGIPEPGAEEAHYVDLGWGSARPRLTPELFREVREQRDAAEATAARLREEVARLGDLSSSAISGGGPEPEPEKCERLLVGQGTDTWDPTCVLPKGHGGACRPDPDVEEGRAIVENDAIQSERYPQWKVDLFRAGMNERQQRDHEQREGEKSGVRPPAPAGGEGRALADPNAPRGAAILNLEERVRALEAERDRQRQAADDWSRLAGRRRDLIADLEARVQRLTEALEDAREALEAFSFDGGSVDRLVRLIDVALAEPPAGEGA